jgi:hypothetical protein
VLLRRDRRQHRAAVRTPGDPALGEHREVAPRGHRRHAEARLQIGERLDRGSRPYGLVVESVKVSVFA